MDRLRKLLEDARQKVRKFVKYNWHNEPEGDKFRFLDNLYVLGAVRYKPVQQWQRICWNTYCTVSISTFFILVLNAIDETSGKFDVVKATWHGTVVLSTALCFVKDSILNQRFESIETARNYINSKPFGSGDSINDSVCRKKCFQRLQLAALVLIVAQLMDEIIFHLPNIGIDELFASPRILQRLGPAVVNGIYFLFMLTLCPVWINKYFAGTGTVCSLLYGFKTEYEIFVRGFVNILDNVYLDVEEKLPSTSKTAPELKRYRRDQLYWKYLEQRVNDQVKLHVEFVENLQLLQPTVKDLFGVIYYNAMITFSPFFYVVLFKGFSVISLYLLSGISLFLLECYGWCSIIESLQDINEDLEVEIMDLITKIPQSQLHHKKYVELQTTLGIMKIFVRNHTPFSCGGVFPINVEAFTDLLNIGYTVLTFLRDIGKKG